MIRVRTITDDDFEGVAGLTGRVFGKSDAQQMQEELKAALQYCPFMRRDLCWIAEENGEVLAKWQFLDFVIRVAGVDMRAAGAQAFVAEPSQRGRGPATQLVPVAHAGIIAEGFDVTFGFAERGVFYEKIGAAPTMANYWLRIEPRRIPRLVDDPFTALTPYSEADLEPIIEHFGRSNANRSGSMVRTVKHWGWMPRRPTHIAICPDGYIGYRLGSDAIEVREIGGNSIEFYNTALRKLGALAREAGLNEVRGAIPIDHPFAQVSTSYGASVDVEYPAHSGAMVLILNMEPFIAKLVPAFERRLAASAFGDTRIQFSLRCESVDVKLDLNPSASGDLKLELELPHRAMLWLAFGYLSVETVFAREGIASRSFDENSRRLLDVLFPQGHPFMWEPDRF